MAGIDTGSFCDNYKDEITNILDGVKIKIDYVEEDGKVTQVIFNFSNGKKIICDRRGS